MTTIFRASGASDFLALVPHLLSYSPARSLVLVPFSGARSLGAMRIDLPSSAESVEIDRLASTFIGMVCKVGAADGVAPVVYTDEEFAVADGIPHDRLVSALLARADLCGLRVVDALCVAADGWGSYLDPSCPEGGRPLGDLSAPDDPRLEEFPRVADDQRAGAGLPAADLAEKERVGQAVIALQAALDLLTDDEEPDAAPSPDIRPRALAAACDLDDIPLLYESVLAWDAGDLDPYDAAALAWCLARPALRDVALLQWSGGLADGDDALDAQMRWLDEDAPIPEELGDRMSGLGPRPDPDRLARALAVVRLVAASCPRDLRPGPLAVCAWLAWALGRSTHTGVYAAAALEIDPSHGLAGIMRAIVGAAHLPEWAYERIAT